MGLKAANEVCEVPSTPLAKGALPCTVHVPIAVRSGNSKGSNSPWEQGFKANPALFARFAVDWILVVAKHRRYNPTFARLIDRVQCCDGFEVLQQR